MRLVEAVERGPAAAGAVAQRVRGVGFAHPVGREDDRLEQHEQPEQRRLSRGSHHERRPAHGVPEADDPAGATRQLGEGGGSSEGVVAVALPRCRPPRRQRRVAVAAGVHAPRVELRGQRLGDREVGVTVEARGVGEQHDRVGRAAGEVVDRNRHAVGGGGVDHGRPAVSVGVAAAVSGPPCAAPTTTG